MSASSATAPVSPAGPTLADLPHDSLRINLIVAAVICWFIAAAFTSLRFYTRVRILHVLGWPDWCILTSLMFSFGMSTGAIDEAVHGSGSHIWDLDPTDTQSLMAWIRASWYALLFYSLSLGFTKISILGLYLRIFTYRWVQQVGRTIMAIVVITTIYMALTIFTFCVPLASYWDHSIHAQYCHPQPVWWTNTSILIATDFLIFLLPLPVVWRLKLPRRQKYILLGIFGLGFFTCLISILRLQSLIQVENYPNPDFTYAGAPLTFWTIIEVNSGIVVACMMTLKPFVNKFFPMLLGTSSSRSSGSSPSGGVRRTTRSVGVKPSLEPIYSDSTHDPWHIDFLDDGDEVELNSKEVQVSHAGSSSSHKPDLEAQRRERITSVPDFPASPPGARLKAPFTNGFYISSSDKSAPDLYGWESARVTKYG